MEDPMMYDASPSPVSGNWTTKMSYLEKMDGYLHSLKVGKSPVVDSWLFMSGPIPILTILTVYFTFVRLGPKIMKDKPPLQFNKILMYYNGLQVALSVVLIYKAFNLRLFRDGLLQAGCRYPSSTLNLELLDLGWWYFFAKFTELLDTVFFILRKKDNQVTFLHVYHHGLMAFYSWSYLKFQAGGEGAILALLNSGVHVVMYSYYLLSGLGPKIQKYLWWKKYVTTLQMTQFLIMLTYCAVTHFSPHCQYASNYTYFICFNITAFLGLFYNFYYQSYNKSKKGRRCLTDNAKEKVQNGNFSNGHKAPNDDDIPVEVKSNIGDYSKNGRVYLSRRTAKAAYGADYNFESHIK